jgi:hypothetical protein
MIIYSITTTVKKEKEQEWLTWMKRKHIQDILNTGYFSSYRIFSIKIPTGLEGESSYIIQYECESMENYLNYAEKDAPRLQADYTPEFIGKIITARTVMEAI